MLFCKSTEVNFLNLIFEILALLKKWLLGISRLSIVLKNREQACTEFYETSFNNLFVYPVS